MNWKTIFNPFEKFNEKVLLLAGCLSLLLTCLLSYLFNNPVYSIYKIGSVVDLDLATAVLFVSASFFCAIIALVVLGKILNKNCRIIDIVNALLISQIPILLLFLITNIPILKDLETRLNRDSNLVSNLSLYLPELILLSLFALIILAVLTYSIVLLYNGFRVAVNLKTWQQSVIFAIVLIFLTLISQIFIPTLKF